MWIPLGVALVFTYGAVTWLGWWRPVLHDHEPVQRRPAIVPIVLIISILIGVDYGELADTGIGYVLVLLIATQLVGWARKACSAVLASRRDASTGSPKARWRCGRASSSAPSSTSCWPSSSWCGDTTLNQ
jgi:hypothetical protein